MPISQVTVSGTIMLPTNQPADINSVVFELLGNDSEDGQRVAKLRVTGVPGENGTFSITLWPNDAGERSNTRYKVDIRLNGGATLDPIPNLFIRASDAARPFEDLVLEQTTLVVGYLTRVVTRAEYDALTVYAPNTIYLVKV